jgi:hypothetical protein
VYGVDGGVCGTSLLQRLVKYAAALDGDYSGETACKLLSPIANATAKVKHCTLWIDFLE